MDYTDRELAGLVIAIVIALVLACAALAIGVKMTDTLMTPEPKKQKAESCIYIREAAICQPRKQ